MSLAESMPGCMPTKMSIGIDLPMHAKTDFDLKAKQVPIARRITAPPMFVL